MILLSLNSVINLKHGELIGLQIHASCISSGLLWEGKALILIKNVRGEVLSCITACVGIEMLFSGLESSPGLDVDV